MYNSIKNILNNYFNYINENSQSFKLNSFEFLEDQRNYGIDAGIKTFNHVYLRSLGGYFINLVCSTEEKPIISAQGIIFTNVKELKYQSLKNFIESYSFLRDFCKEIEYSIDDLIENYFKSANVADFISKVRDFAEIALLVHVLKNYEGIVLRDGLFYFPYNFPGFEHLKNVIYEYKDKVISVSKSSMLLRDPKITKSIDFNVNFQFYANPGKVEYYTKYYFDFLRNYIVRFSNIPGSREIYHIQCYDPKILSFLKIIKTFYYPSALYLADKYSHLEDKEITVIESKILKENYDVLRKLYSNMFKYQRERMKGSENFKN